MPRLTSSIVLRVALAPLCLAASGCFIPGGGWTLRTGVDLRRKWKPSAFVELVDTKWDEYNRVEDLNMSGFFPDQGAVFHPGAPPIETAPVPEPAPTTSSDPLKTAAPPSGYSSPPTSAPGGREPNLLPGTSNDESDETRTVQRSPTMGPQLPDSLDGVSEAAATTPKPPRRPLASRLFARP
ncbi:MAG: hypothetical protein HY290_22125 [Planctomycetia bacterium]|nr:hypothetical protein [Planctomycetia bacterium]